MTYLKLVACMELERQAQISFDKADAISHPSDVLLSNSRKSNERVHFCYQMWFL
jgi:hypothetical protein